MLATILWREECDTMPAQENNAFKATLVRARGAAELGWDRGNIMTRQENASIVNFRLRCLMKSPDDEDLAVAYAKAKVWNASGEMAPWFTRSSTSDIPVCLW
jgi:hypothetical protein